MQEAFGGARIIARGNEFNIEGDEAAIIGRFVEELSLLLEHGQVVDPQVVARTIDILRADELPSEVLTAEVLRSAGQVGPAEVGRPKALCRRHKFQHRHVWHRSRRYRQELSRRRSGRPGAPGKIGRRIIMTRPAVEAGERLGFLPGDLMAKIDPYLRPLYDALYDMLGTEGGRRLLDNGTIEVAPLAYIRGRTLNRSFIILDEAQNATPEQLKMFLTRIGFGSKVVVNGDITQVDLPGGRSGLAELEHVLNGVEGIAFVRLTSRDVVRHRIVADIVSAYDAYESTNNVAGKPVLRREAQPR